MRMFILNTQNIRPTFWPTFFDLYVFWGILSYRAHTLWRAVMCLTVARNMAWLVLRIRWPFLRMARSLQNQVTLNQFGHLWHYFESRSPHNCPVRLNASDIDTLFENERPGWTREQRNIRLNGREVIYITGPHLFGTPTSNEMAIKRM